MSNQYKKGSDVPIDVLVNRVNELVKAITAGDSGKSLMREFVMHIPVQLDSDADVVLSEMKVRLLDYHEKLEQATKDKAKLVRVGNRLAGKWEEFIDLGEGTSVSTGELDVEFDILKSILAKHSAPGSEQQ